MIVHVRAYRLGGGVIKGRREHGMLAIKVYYTLTAKNVSLDYLIIEEPSVVSDL